MKARKLALELLMGDHDGDCQGPCKLNCPAHTDCQKYVKEIAEGRFADAAATVMETFPIPASIGRVCPHPCEKACRRRLVEAPISIAQLKYFAADQARKDGTLRAPSVARPTGKKVGIIGGGPAGLTAAFKLAQWGHAVTVYDQMPEMGGMLRYGIPAYRLPKDVLKAETDAIEALGVTFVNDFKIGRDAKFEDLCGWFDAVIVANGAWKSTSMRVKGEDLAGVWGGIDFLRAVATGGKPTSASASPSSAAATPRWTPAARRFASGRRRCTSSTAVPEGRCRPRTSRSPRPRKRASSSSSSTPPTRFLARAAR
jgi:formate dehydrogenase major subunit